MSGRAGLPRMRAGEVWHAERHGFFLVTAEVNSRGARMIRKLYKTRDPGRRQSLAVYHLKYATWRLATEDEKARLIIPQRRS